MRGLWLVNQASSCSLFAVSGSGARSWLSTLPRQGGKTPPLTPPPPPARNCTHFRLCGLRGPELFGLGGSWASSAEPWLGVQGHGAAEESRACGLRPLRRQAAVQEASACCPDWIMQILPQPLNFASLDLVSGKLPGCHAQFAMQLHRGFADNFVRTCRCT